MVWYRSRIALSLSAGMSFETALELLWNWAFIAKGGSLSVARKCSGNSLSRQSETHSTCPQTTPELLGNCSRKHLVLLRNCSEIAPKLMQTYSGNCSSKIAPKTVWKCSKRPLKLLRNCSETALKLLRNCSEIDPNFFEELLQKPTETALKLL